MRKINTAKICNIGNEILNGKTLNTNSYFLSKKFENKNICVLEQIVIPDCEEKIINILKKYCDKKTIIIFTGGLGPTNDDKTVDSICKFLKKKAIYEPLSKQKLETSFLKYSKKNYNNKRFQMALRQIRVPEDSVPLQNMKGFAPGIWIPEYLLLCLPGFPNELEAIWSEFEKNYLNTIISSKFLYKKKIITFGVLEKVNL